MIGRILFCDKCGGTNITTQPLNRPAPQRVPISSLKTQGNNFQLLNEVNHNVHCVHIIEKWLAACDDCGYNVEYINQ